MVRWVIPIFLLFLSIGSISHAGPEYVKKQVAFFPWAAGRGKHNGTELAKGAEFSGIDENGNIYITDPGSGIRVYSHEAVLLRTVTPPIDLSKSGADVSIDGDGSVYYGVKGTIYRVHPDGKISKYKHSGGETVFVRNGKVYSLKGTRFVKLFEIRKGVELKGKEIIPDLEPGDFSAVHDRQTIYLTIKTQGIKDFLKFHQPISVVPDEVTIEEPRKAHLFANFKNIGIDKNGRMVFWVGFEEKIDWPLQGQFFYVYSLKGNLLVKIPLDDDYIENISSVGGTDIDGDIYHLSTTVKGAFLYKWTPVE